MIATLAWSNSYAGRLRKVDHKEMPTFSDAMLAFCKPWLSKYNVQLPLPWRFSKDAYTCSQQQIEHKVAHSLVMSGAACWNIKIGWIF